MSGLGSRLSGILLLALGGVIADGPTPMADELNVVASIKPVHSLVAGVMQGVAEPHLLVRGTGSEHSYSLRPSQARDLDQADVVFWVGETMETFLIKPLQALSGDAKVVELSELPGLTLLPTREGGMWAPHDHGDEGADADADYHQGARADEQEGKKEHADADQDAAQAPAHGQIDMHIWLDPTNAKIVVSAIATVLGDADRQNATTYRANAEDLREQLDELDRSLEKRLATVANRPYVVFHDAYQYFEHRYGVNAVGAISVNPTLRPSAQRLDEIQERLQQLDAACVFAEPQFEPALVDTVIQGTSAQKGVLDPLGAALPEGPDQYFLLMNGLADSLIDCLGTTKSD